MWYAYKCFGDIRKSSPHCIWYGMALKIPLHQPNRAPQHRTAIIACPSSPRIMLQKFFFPNDYTEAPVTHYPQPGEKRVYLFFDIAVSLSSPGTFNIYFQDKQVGCTQAPTLV